PRPMAKHSVPETPRAQPQPDPVIPTPKAEPAPVASADATEVEELLAQVTGKVANADQAIAPIRDNLARNGSVLAPDTSAAIDQMHAALERGKRYLAAGKLAQARESLGVADAFAGKILKKVGR